MTEEMPKNYYFLKFIVIFMGILIVLGLAVMVWKVIDLAQQRTARQAQRLVAPEKIPHKLLKGELTLKPGERILQISPTERGLWIRLGRDGVSTRLILKDFTGRTIATIGIKRDHENPLSVK